MTDQSNNPRRFLGRKASPCRRCIGVLHYVNRMGGVVCEECEPPRSPADVLLRMICSGGQWDDRENPMDVAAPIAAPPVEESAAKSTSNSKSQPQLPPGTIITPDSTRAIRELAADRRMSPAEWLEAMSAVFTDREAEFGWSPVPGVVALRELRDLVRRDFPDLVGGPVQKSSDGKTESKIQNAGRIFQ